METRIGFLADTDLLKMKDIAIYGGAFDPIHLGHIDVAKAIIDEGLARQVRFVPAAKHLFNKSLVDFWSRVHWINLSIAERSDYNFLCSSMELNNPDGSMYSLINSYKELYPDKSFTIVIGCDNVGGLPRWKNYEALIKENHFTIVDRYDSLSKCDLSFLPYYDSCYKATRNISSSNIKEMIKAKVSIKSLVCENIEESLIKEYGK